MIELIDLNFSYNKKKIFSQFNLHIPKDKFVAIIGPNGCGKSTLLKLLGKELTASSGGIKVDNQNINDYDDLKYAQKIAFSRQVINNVFPFSCLDYVLLGRRPYKSSFEDYDINDYNIVEASFKRTETGGFMEKKLTEISGGELQRINLAKILTQETDYLLLDESFSAMDIYHKVESLKLLKSLSKQTVICVMHDLNLVYQNCDYVIILEKGEVMYEGHPKEVLKPENLKEVYGVEMEYIPGKGFFINGGTNE